VAICAAEWALFAQVRSRLAVIKLSHIAEPVEQLRAQLIRSATPAPITRRNSRYVHSRFGSEAEQVLQGRNRKIGDGRPSNSHQSPYWIFIDVRFVPAQELPFFFRDRVPPAESRVVVVRARVNDGVPD